jgi:hypothetical protein
LIVVALGKPASVRRLTVVTPLASRASAIEAGEGEHLDPTEVLDPR